MIEKQIIPNTELVRNQAHTAGLVGGRAGLRVRLMKQEPTTANGVNLAPSPVISLHLLLLPCSFPRKAGCQIPGCKSHKWSYLKWFNPLQVLYQSLNNSHGCFCEKPLS